MHGFYSNLILAYLMFVAVMGMVLARSDDQLQPVYEAPPVTVEETSRYSQRSIETLVVVLAAIVIVGVIAGVIARLCGGRHFSDNGEDDIEGWVERKCRSCIDGGLPPTPAPAPPPPPPPEGPKPAAATEEAKK